ALGRLLPAGADGPPKVAAGGVVVRRGPGGPEVLVVHRVRHDDWSLPKGATAPGETARRCAEREVREETGLRCRLGAEIPGVTYRDRNNRVKQVRFWRMTPLGRVGTPDPAEVDAVRWVPLADAAGVLTRRRDREVVRAFAREHGTGAVA
ncbi:MAG: NUDIX hydrolase, partial [Pseudonocardiales bacterium]|nr:NUDIX hydrolase [Pseudonocardiales bacterium]